MDLFPKVSILVTVYNLAPYLQQTLDSILSQDYPNLEIVIADDASNDDSTTILKKYLEQHPNKIVLVLNEQNQGVTANSNAAFAVCTGDLIAIFDGDDVMLPGKINAQVNVFTQDPDVTLCYHAAEIFDSVSGDILYITDQNPGHVLKNAYDIILYGGISHTSSVMVKRSACPKKGFDLRFPDLQDWLFFIEVALRGKVAKLDRVYTRYRKHGKGISNRTYQLLGTSLGMLDALIVDHPELPELQQICRKGKARYIAGEVFRQLGQDVNIANKLAWQMVQLDSTNIKYWLLFFISSLPPVARLIGPTFNRFKYLIKRSIV